MSEEENIETNPEPDNTESPQDVNTKPSIDQTENSQPEIPTSENKKMEVHHHPDLHHKSKAWKEYFLEFLMIFLAVTLGFFAENLREHIKNKEDIHQDIESVLADLESDVAHFNVVLDVNGYSYKVADSLVSLLHNDISNTSQVYFYARAVTSNVTFFYTNSKTFDLMKASGTLKLVSPRSLLDSLGLYYVTFQLLTKQDDFVRLKNDAIHKGNSLLFDNYIFSQMTVGYNSMNTSHTIVHPPSGHPALLSTDFKTVNEVALNYYYFAATVKFGCMAAEQQKQLALRLIASIKKEYNQE